MTLEMPRKVVNELNICVVDDDAYYNRLLVQMIRNCASEGQKMNIETYSSGHDCLKNMSHPEIVFLDFYLSTKNDITHTGLDTLKKLKKVNPDSTVIFVSKVHDWENFKDDLKAEGAMDFIKKDESLQQNIQRIIHGLE